MEGETEESEKEGSFSKASIKKRIAIVAAGAIVNIIFAIIVYFILMASIGTYLTNEVENVLDGYVSKEIGLQNGDFIEQINGKKVNNKYDLDEIMESNNGNEMNIKIRRNNETLEYSIIPTKVNTDETNNNSKYYLGITLKKAPDTYINRCINGAIETKKLTFSIMKNLKEMFTGKVQVEDMMGPVGISEAVAKTDGWYEFIYMLALISLSLGVTNLLPIPALDGGKILILIVEAIRRKPLKMQTEINIQLIGFSILIALSLYVTYNDVLRIF